VKKNAEYYFGVDGGKAIEAMTREELYRGLAECYQLAGSLLIGADVKERYAPKGKKPRNANGWTDDQIDCAVEVILNFLSNPARVHQVDFDRVRFNYVAPEVEGMERVK
jgi:hypothetical protein